MESRALHMLSKCFSSELQPQPWFVPEGRVLECRSLVTKQAQVHALLIEFISF